MNWVQRTARDPPAFHDRRVDARRRTAQAEEMRDARARLASTGLAHASGRPASALSTATPFEQQRTDAMGFLT
jgi:hypothetical protein